MFKKIVEPSSFRDGPRADADRFEGQQAAKSLDYPQAVESRGASHIQLSLVEQSGQGVDHHPPSPSGSSSSGATHISAGSVLQSLNVALPTSSATVQSDTDNLPSTPSGIQQPSRSSPSLASKSVPASANADQPSYKLSSSVPVTFPTRGTPPSASSVTPRVSKHTPAPPARRLKDKKDPLPPHLRAILEEFYSINPGQLAPCTLASENRHSVYIFPGGKLAKYIDLQGTEVRFRRCQLPENSQYVNIVDGPNQPPVLVKRLPKADLNPSYPGSALTIWEGIRGFRTEPSFFKVIAGEGDTENIKQESKSEPPPKKPRLMEPTPINPSQDVSASDHHRVSATLDKRSYPHGLETVPPYGGAPPFMPAAPTPARIDYSAQPDLSLIYPKSQQGPGGYSQGSYPHSNGRTDSPKSGEPTNAPATPFRPPQATTSILSPDQQSRTVVTFIGGSIPRKRPFTMCDTSHKFFVQAAAAGFKHFSLNALSFVIVKIFPSGHANEEGMVRELAVVKGDEIDFQQLQEMIKQVGTWDNPQGGCDCEVKIID